MKTKGFGTLTIVVVVIGVIIVVAGVSGYFALKGIDTTPPLITEVNRRPEENSVIITWKTNEPSDSVVKYGENYPSLTKSSSTMVRDHWITITGLEPGTKYYFEIFSTDKAGNTARSPDEPNLAWIFKTKPPSEQLLTVGKTAKTSEMEVTVITAEVATSFTKKDGDMEMSPVGKVFVIIDVEVKYTGATSKYIRAGDFWLVDSRNVYTESGTYSLESGFESVTLYPNQESMGKILFEVPEGTNGLKAQADFGTYSEPEKITWELGLVISFKTLPPIADAHVKPGEYENSNFGGDSSMHLNSTYYYIGWTRYMGPSTKAYIKFDLAAIPSGVTINSAKLKSRFSSVNETREIRVYYCPDDTWTETGITWRNAPPKGNLVSAVTVSKEDWYDWDVTKTVRGAISKGELSLVLEINLEGISEYRYIYASFYSKEEGYYPPRLEISYTS